MDILAHIKRLLLQGRVIFTVKAQSEMYLDSHTDDEVIEAIINAPSINKALRSTSRRRVRRKERLYVILGTTYDGVGSEWIFKALLRRPMMRDNQAESAPIGACGF